MPKVMTAEMVLTRTKADSLEQVRNLNMWGNELESVETLKQMPNIEVLSLSVNKIRTLRDFASCRHLKELYLRKNLITDIEEI